MKKKSKRKLGKPTQEDLTQLTENFSEEEFEKIQVLLVELRKIRTIDKSGNIEKQLKLIAEQEFFYVGDAILSFGWQNNKEKISALWKYLQQELS
jgi:hypothetical protein